MIRTPLSLRHVLHRASGNIGEVTQLSECEYDIKIRPDTNNNRHRLWFYFSASNIANNQQVGWRLEVTTSSHSVPLLALLSGVR